MPRGGRRDAASDEVIASVAWFSMEEVKGGRRGGVRFVYTLYILIFDTLVPDG
jgi:hypothetical protein